MLGIWVICYFQRMSHPGEVMLEVSCCVLRRSSCVCAQILMMYQGLCRQHSWILWCCLSDCRIRNVAVHSGSSIKAGFVSLMRTLTCGNAPTCISLTWGSKRLVEVAHLLLMVIFDQSCSSLEVSLSPENTGVGRPRTGFCNPVILSNHLFSLPAQNMSTVVGFSTFSFLFKTLKRTCWIHHTGTSFTFSTAAFSGIKTSP